MWDPKVRQERFGNVVKTRKLRKHLPPGFARARRRPQGPIKSTTEDTYFTSCDSLFFDVDHLTFSCVIYDVLDTLVHVVHTDDFLHHQTQDPCRNAGSHNYSCHDSTCLPRYSNFTDCDQHVPVHTFDHNTTSTPSICLFPAVPEAAHRLPVICTSSFLNNDLPLPFSAQDRQESLPLDCVQRKCALRNSRPR